MTGWACRSANFIAIQLLPQMQRERRRARRTRRAAMRTRKRSRVNVRARRETLRCAARPPPAGRDAACGRRRRLVSSVGRSERARTRLRDLRARRRLPPSSSHVGMSRILGGDPQHRRLDARQTANTSSMRDGRRERQLVLADPARSRAVPSGNVRGPVRREERGLVARKPRVVLLQPVGDGLEDRRTARTLGGSRKRVEPRREACPARARAVSAGMPKPSSAMTCVDAFAVRTPA